MALARPDLSEGAADLAEPSDGSAGDALPATTGPTRYPAGILHSAMSPAVVDRLSLVLSSGGERPAVFAKVGDSITADTHFLSCFAGTDLMLQSSSGDEPTRQYFAATDLGGTTSFDRVSLAAGVGWHATTELVSPSPLTQELDAIQPGFAVMMLGTNDTDPSNANFLYAFESNLTADVDALLSRGVVPLLSSIPPRGDDATINAAVPEQNAVVRAIAQHRQIPYMDFWQTLIGLPSYGLGGDGVHPQVYVSGTAHGCWFTDPALQFGVNQRNKLVLDALDRVKRAVVDGTLSESPPPSLSGSGTFSDPYLVDALPFVDSADTTLSSSSTVNVYSCAPQNEGGPEIVYRIDVTQAATLRARVFVDAGVDVDLHWLSAPDGNSCISRADKTIDLAAQPGTYWLSVDSFVSGGVAKAGAYRLTVLAM
jgi:GDSL-like Lipase/Acylhydrolase family